MASNSIRVTTELFDQARQQGELMSRSAAQQLEYWARLGIALESSGLSAADASSLLRGSGTSLGVAIPLQVAEPEPEDAWATKRRQQASDIAAVRSGRVRSDAMSWFSGGRARAARLKNSPY